MSTATKEKFGVTPVLSERARTRKAAILQASSGLIAEHGFDGTSLEAICEKAACSKSAIYALFGNKEGILSALSEELALGLSQALHAFHIQNLSPAVALQRYAQMVMERVLSDSYIGIIRAIISVSWRHREIGPAYYHVGAGAARNALAGYLRSQHEAGLLNITNAERCADEFQGMLLWDRMLAQLVGAVDQPSPEHLDQHVQSTVDLFINRYSYSSGPESRSSDHETQ